MPYVKRDAEGAVVAVYHQPVEEGLDQVSVDDPGLGVFLHHTLLDLTVNRHWTESDLGLTRVVEDMVDMLIERGVFLFTDLPEPAQKKLLERRGLRKEFAYMDTLFGDDDAFEADDGGEDFL